MDGNETTSRGSQEETKGEIEERGFKKYIDLLWDEGIKLGLKYKDMYDMDLYELQNAIEKTREGLAYVIWRLASLTYSPFVKNFPETPQEAMPELYPKKATIAMPDFLKDKYYKQKGVKKGE